MSYYLLYSKRKLTWPQYLAGTFFILGAVALFLLLSGCVVAPKPVAPTQVPFEGSLPTGGALKALPDGDYEIARDRESAYESLIKLGYGKGFLPPLKNGDGVTSLPDGNFSIDDQHLTYFIAMASRWRRGEAP